MGVSGCGKSSVAAAMAAQLGWRVVDADDLHSAASVAKMRSGEALTDADRGPWLDRVGAVLAEASAHSQGVLVACSALKRSYRDRLRGACPEILFLFLDGSRDTIADRMSRRPGHYMPASLLDSQWRTLERPGDDEADVCRIDVDPGLDDVLRQAQAALSSAHRSSPKRLGEQAA